MLFGEVSPHLGQRDRTFPLPVPAGLWQLCYAWPWRLVWLWLFCFGRLAFIVGILPLSFNDRVDHCLFDPPDGSLPPIVVALDVPQPLPELGGC